MSNAVDLIREKIHQLELELESELARQRVNFQYGLERGKVLFEQEVLRRHRELKTSLGRYLMRTRPLVALTAPFIYSMIIPFALIDLWVSIYQAVCFRVYGIPQVKRSGYMVFDRSALAYLNILQKLNCAYCSYGNGVAAYVREISARTEQYWCPIKHAKRVIGEHARYAKFQEYGDAEHYRVELERLRAALRAEQEDGATPPLERRP
jgi:hypothetical protein